MLDPMQSTDEVAFDVVHHERKQQYTANQNNYAQLKRDGSSIFGDINQIVAKADAQYAEYRTPVPATNTAAIGNTPKSPGLSLTMTA